MPIYKDPDTGHIIKTLDGKVAGCEDDCCGGCTCESLLLPETGGTNYYTPHCCKYLSISFTSPNGGDDPVTGTLSLPIGASPEQWGWFGLTAPTGDAVYWEDVEAFCELSGGLASEDFDRDTGSWTVPPATTAKSIYIRATVTAIGIPATATVMFEVPVDDCCPGDTVSYEITATESGMESFAITGVTVETATDPVIQENAILLFGGSGTWIDGHICDGDPPLGVCCPDEATETPEFDCLFYGGEAWYEDGTYDPSDPCSGDPWP